MPGQAVRGDRNRRLSGLGRVALRHERMLCRHALVAADPVVLWVSSDRISRLDLDDDQAIADLYLVALVMGLGVEDCNGGTVREGLLRVWLTSLTRNEVSRKGCRHAEEVSAGVQA